MVTLPKFTLPFEVYTDASMESCGAVLAQDVDGLEWVVAYTSQVLTHTHTHKNGGPLLTGSCGL